MTVIKLLLIIVAGIILIHQVVMRIVRRFWHFPAPAFISHVLDSKLRQRVQPPERLMKWSGIAEGMTVLDLGCGSGALTIPYARAVGQDGRVYALDIQPDMLALLAQKLAQPDNKGISNVLPIRASAEDLPFADNSLDVVCVTTVLYEIPDPQQALREIKRVLRVGGYLAISELFMDPDYRLKSTTIKLGLQAGFVLEEAFGNLWAYTVRFTRLEAI